MVRTGFALAVSWESRWWEGCGVCFASGRALVGVAWCMDVARGCWGRVVWVYRLRLILMARVCVWISWWLVVELVVRLVGERVCRVRCMGALGSRMWAYQRRLVGGLKRRSWRLTAMRGRGAIIA